MNSKKIINDPVHGFISIPGGTIYSLISHPWFQRLTRIRQLGMTYLVYPGALHTRFHHTLGAMHLMQQAIETLKWKGHVITDKEAEAAGIAILMHDIGHGPFSHALEHLLAPGVSHEKLSSLFMDRLNQATGGKLEEAITIFNDTHPKKFLHQLVSSQLDVDRLDYLSRDSFFTGVSEGVISSDRIIKMLEVHDGNVVVESKGIYSIEKFITARRLMYWQVYLHKTVVSAEQLLVRIIERARALAGNGTELFATPAFNTFLYRSYSLDDFSSNPVLLDTFSKLDDFDVFTSIKEWCYHPDKVLSTLCQWLVNRNLYHIEINTMQFDENEVEAKQLEAMKRYGISREDAAYFVFTGTVENKAYSASSEKIYILFKNSSVEDIALASDNLNISVLSNPVTKYFLCTDRHPA
ncbi:MAG TPA: HD domain-containing protein [Bacteroidia bacterium]|nr:HD domain-containing protein [Bacteroidia bacterium]